MTNIKFSKLAQTSDLAVNLLVHAKNNGASDPKAAFQEKLPGKSNTIELTKLEQIGVKIVNYDGVDHVFFSVVFV